MPLPSVPILLILPACLAGFADSAAPNRKSSQPNKRFAKRISSNRGRSSIATRFDEINSQGAKLPDELIDRAKLDLKRAKLAKQEERSSSYGESYALPEYGGWSPSGTSPLGTDVP